VTIDPVMTMKAADRSTVAGYLDFTVSVSPGDGQSADAVVHVAGDLDCYSSPQLRSTFLELVAEGHRQVVLDVGATNFVDSTGLGVLVGGVRRFRQEGGDLVLRSPSPATVRLLEVTGLTSVFSVV
jgi:anti-sigma B factor antagonist